MSSVSQEIINMAERMSGCHCLPGKIVFIITLTLLIQQTATNVRNKRLSSSSQPTIVTENGHLIFQTGPNRDIKFRSSSGGSVFIDENNLKEISEAVKSNKRLLQDLQANSNVNTATPDHVSAVIEERLSQLEQGLNNLQPTGAVQEQLASLVDHIITLQNGASTAEETVTSLSDLVESVKNQVLLLNTHVATLNELLTTDECSSHPCQHGGTCVDKFGGYFCRCPPAWEGPHCEADVNECYEYAGTDLGCQNGGTCRDEEGGFRCDCTANFHGTLCQTTHNDCNGVSHEALCSHGTCVDSDRVLAGNARYQCVCDSGWTKSETNPACVIDVNECDLPSQPCSVDPPVSCVNIPGTFHCGPCPAGYIGNGFHCADINECEVNNGGCSMAPSVECINTRGSRRCGPCPGGYQGDGVTCEYVGICHINNGGCHPLASCHENVAVAPGFRSCTCPTGYDGDGVGYGGCVQQTAVVSTVCNTNSCMRQGLCVPQGSSYSCQCYDGYTGHNCETDINECDSFPCQNDGTCTDGVNSYSCVCPNTHTGPQCQTPQDVCGGDLEGDAGNFAYPSQSGTEYDHLVNCIWTITVSPNKAIQLTFTEFDIQQSTNCVFDYLEFHDGDTYVHDEIGKYCGTELPDPITSSTNHLYFLFHSGVFVTGGGFTFHWISIDPVCGGDMTGSNHGEFTSPGYPGNYPHNRDCFWNIYVDAGQRIVFTFATLALEQHSSCSYDYIKIRDGVLMTDPILQKYCSTSVPPPLEMSGSSAQVHFHSDNSIDDGGFHITYSTVAADDGCGGLLTEENGIVRSPGFPNTYAVEGVCIWQINVLEGERITFEFTKLDLIGTSTQCEDAYVELRDGESEDAPLLGRYCGTEEPAIITTGNALYIKFKSNVNVQGEGFNANWGIVCGGRFTAENGIIMSPAYPMMYSHNRQCHYIISQPEGKVITISFLDFDLEASFGGCVYDYLEVYDSPTVDPSNILGRFCGTTVPGPLVSTENNMLLVFKTDHNGHGRGFKIQYTNNVQGCGGTFTEQAGVIQIPTGSELEYPNGANCTWFISLDPGFVVRLVFHVFSLESHPECEYDSVQVFDHSDSINTGDLLGKYCGTSLPPVLTSSGNTMTVFFTSDEIVTHEGFSASYIGLDESRICGADLTDLQGEITSPNFPDNYPDNKHCTWTIVVLAGYQIQLNVTDFSLENATDCRFDSLEIRNGGYPSSPQIGLYCGLSIDRIITSHSNRIWIQFTSDGYIEESGFRITYHAAMTGCGGDLTTPSATITSPGYPMAYHHQAECIWTIRISHGSKINFIFTDFDVEAHSSCIYDYVEIRDGGPTGISLGRFCGNTNPGHFVSTGNMLWVKFSSDVIIDGRGFSASYSTICDNTFTAHQGVIESPNFPHTYFPNLDCEWTITMTTGNKVNVSFSHFQLEDSDHCSSDYLRVTDGATASGTDVVNRCGPNLPVDIHSSSETLHLQFHSNEQYQYNGFRLEYIFDGCGGTFRGQTGQFTSPNYPNNYPLQAICEWIIMVEYGFTIELTINEMAIRSDCLDVYDGGNTDAVRLLHICQGATGAQTLAGHRHVMLVKFTSDSYGSDTGFSITYRAVEAGCGGNFTTPTGTITSKGFPDDYPDGVVCEWLISVTPGHAVELVFQTMNIPSDESCGTDVVIVYDGPDRNAPELLKHCGTALPDPETIVSADNQLFIFFKSDDSIHAQGFKASYNLGCGGTEDADAGGVINAPTELSGYRSYNCTWIMQSTDNTKRVTLTITDLSLYQSAYVSGCLESNALSVYDGDSVTSPLIGTYCGTTIPTSITSHGASLTVHYIAFYSSYRAFRATYTTSSSVCGAEFGGMAGAFNSPAFPESYPLDTECVWSIRVSYGNTVQLSFSMFDIEQSDFCNLDHVEVREQNEEGRYIGRYCGNIIPSNNTALNVMWVRFRSDSHGTGVGFMAQYSMVFFNEITGASGQIASPLNPNHYQVNTDTVWIITVAENRRIHITFETMDIEYSSTCYWDWLKIFDGPIVTSSPLLHKYCGSDVPQDIIISTSNQMRLEFHSDYSINGQGFLLSWFETTDVMMPTTAPVAGCGGALLATVTEQTLTSPGYPNGTTPGLDCLWRIVGPSGYKIEFNLTHMDLDDSFNFCMDYVQLFDPNSPLGVYYEGFFFANYEESDYKGVVDPNQLGYPLTYRYQYCGRLTVPAIVQSSGGSMNVVFRTGYLASNITGFEATYKLVCGAVIRGDRSGVIQSPNYPEAYPNDHSCVWKIYVGNDRTIRVTFVESDDFDFDGSSGNCDSDYITLLNGDSTDSPALGDADNGRYCGNSAPSTLLETSDNKLYISFTSDGSNSASGFRLQWEEVEKSCGYHVTLSDLTDASSSHFIMSPNYPDDYHHNSECEWVIMAPGTERIRVDFVDGFDIEHGTSSGCEYDYILLRDGATSNAPLLLDPHCGTTTPNTLYTHGNALYIKFRTDDSQTGKGFKARVYIAKCGGFHYGTEGTITSIHNPSDYESNLECLWTFQAPGGHSLTFTFNSFELESSPNCTKDFLVIREPNSTDISTDTVTLLPPTCGSSIPSPVFTADSLAYIKFVTDSSNSAPGFEITYTASAEACGGSLRTPSGSFTSPNFPDYFPRRRTCTWNIEVSFGRRVTLTIDELNIASGYYGYCNYMDNVQVYNGILYTSHYLALYCDGIPFSEPIESTGNTLKVVFHTDGSESNGGFRAHYTSDNEAICGGLLTSNHGNITSPGYGEDDHPHNLQCIWLLENPAHVQSSIVLTFNTFHLEEQQVCAWDYLDVREGIDEQGDLIDKYCGNRTDIAQIISPAPSLWILFHSDFMVAKAGFFLQYEYTACGGLMADPVGAITSPGYSQNYAPNSRCAWKIVAPEGDQIKIETIHFQTEENTDCASDYVEIFNGGDYNAPSIGRFCGNNGPPEFTTGSNMLRVVFSSDETGSAQGFKLEYTFLTEACGGLYHSDAGNISTPNWPNNYPHNLECEWDINVDPSYYIILTFIGRFEMAVTGTSCSDDYVEVFDVYTNGTRVSLGKDCRRARPDPKQSTNHMMIVKFRSDQGTVGDGFFASWRSVCGGTYTTESGQLSSPGFPNNYGANLDCSYLIYVGLNKYFFLEFTEFDVGVPDYFCYGNENDYVNVFEGANVNSRWIGTFCGTTAPQAIRAKEEMFIRFHSNAAHQRKGFLASWYIDECGGTFTDDVGVIRSPRRHPVGQDVTNLHCTYTITVADQHIVELAFDTFNFEMSPACEADSLEIFDGPSLTSDSLGKFCGDGIPPRIRSTSNIVTVDFRTDETAEGNEFTAYYKETVGPELGCGGFLNATSGLFQSIDVDGDGQYDVDLDCQWLITVPDNNIIHLTIESVNMESSSNCQYDFIKIWDGFSMTGNNPASVLCGMSSRQFSMLSSTNNLYIQFFSDHVNTGSGFIVTYTSRHAICSGYVVATMDAQPLTSPGFPNASSVESEFADCHWMISAPEGRNVRLEVQNIDIPDSTGCTQNFLSFNDYPRGFRSHKVQYCGPSLPPRFDSIGRNAQVTYRSGAVAENQGMKFTYQIADCHRTYALDNDQIVSPDYPSLSDRAVDCNILFSMPANTYLALYFNTFSIVYSDGCSTGHLKIYNGSDASSTELATHCGVQLPNPIFASGNSLFMNFKTQSSIDFAEFNITYTSSTKPLGCGGTLTALNSILTSPGYPGNYTAAETCDWYIYVPLYHSITMSFHDFQIQAEPNCETDYFEIRLMPSEQIVTTFCGDSLPADLQINSNQIRVRYYSDGTGSSILFKLAYSA